MQPKSDKHIVDSLIEERAENLMRRPWLWSIVRKLFYPVLNYKRALVTVDEVRGFSGVEIMEWMSTKLDLDLRVSGMEYLPKTGAAIAVVNHPAGIADGVAIWDAIKTRRQDMVFFANRDAIRAAPGLADVIIPVEWVDDKRTHERSKETVKQMVQAFRQKRLVVIFPSGRLAQPTWRGLIERPWMPTAVSLAQKYGCPLVPIHLTGRNSWVYYLCYLLSTELRDMTLFRELLNKRGYPYRVRVGEAIHPEGDPKAVTDALRVFVTEQLSRGERSFKPEWNGEQTGEMAS